MFTFASAALIAYMATPYARASDQNANEDVLAYIIPVQYVCRPQCSANLVVLACCNPAYLFFHEAGCSDEELTKIIISATM